MSSPFNESAVKALFRTGGQLLKLVHQFNSAPAAYADPTWLEPLVPQDLFLRLRTTRRGAIRLSEILLIQHGLYNDTCYDFDTRSWRLALLPAEVMNQLSLYVGLSLQHRRIATMVDRVALAGIKKDIGEQAYTFAIKRAPLLTGKRSGVLPIWNGDGDFGSFSRHIGGAYILSHFTQCPKAVAGRIAFKFPRAVSKIVAQRFSEDNGWTFINRILIHEIDPQWQTLFS